MKSAKDLLEDVPLPKANDLFLATAAATLGSGLLTVAKPEKMHDAYFTESDDDGATQVMHKPSTRWLGMSLCWVGAWNVAAALAPEGSAKAKEKLLLANGAGLLAGAAMDSYNIAKKTQKKKVSAAEICTIGTLGALSLARAAKGCKDE